MKRWTLPDDPRSGVEHVKQGRRKGRRGGQEAGKAGERQRLGGRSTRGQPHGSSAGRDPSREASRRQVVRRHRLLALTRSSPRRFCLHPHERQAWRRSPHDRH